MKIKECPPEFQNYYATIAGILAIQHYPKISKWLSYKDLIIRIGFDFTYTRDKLESVPPSGCGIEIYNNSGDLVETKIFDHIISPEDILFSIDENY